MIQTKLLKLLLLLFFLFFVLMWSYEFPRAVPNKNKNKTDEIVKLKEDIHQLKLLLYSSQLKELERIVGKYKIPK